MGLNKRGFTLVELMVVIAIIGILATVAINISLQLTERGHIKTLEADLNAAYKAAVAYFTDEQRAARLPRRSIRFSPWSETLKGK